MANSFPDPIDFKANMFQKLKRPTIGSGGCGKVRLVHLKSDPKRMFAMKTVRYSPQSSRRGILDEINLHKSLGHPNIVKLHGAQILKDRAHIFLDFVSGGDLFSLLHGQKQPNPALTFRLKVKIFFECVMAISHMHERGIIHRDLKPENILLTRDFSVRLCDFGWAVKLSSQRRRRSVCGTVEYMAPEIYMAEMQTEKTDVWALGGSFYFSFFVSLFPLCFVDSASVDLTKNRILTFQGFSCSRFFTESRPTIPEAWMSWKKWSTPSHCL